VHHTRLAHPYIYSYRRSTCINCVCLRGNKIQCSRVVCPSLILLIKALVASMYFFIFGVQNFLNVFLDRFEVKWT
jgi:hypothetical protein